MAVASRSTFPLLNSLPMNPLELSSLICLSRSRRSAFISPMLYSDRSDFIWVIQGLDSVSSLYSLMLLISTWSPNFLWSSVTAGYFRSRSSGSMFSFSMRYSSSWRLSLRSSHLSMPYSL